MVGRRAVVVVRLGVDSKNVESESADPVDGSSGGRKMPISILSTWGIITQSGLMVSHVLWGRRLPGDAGIVRGQSWSRDGTRHSPSVEFGTLDGGRVGNIAKMRTSERLGEREETGPLDNLIDSVGTATWGFGITRVRRRSSL